MPGSTRKLPVWLPILVLLIAMSSIQSGASLAKSLFPLVGAPGVTALRLALGTLILIAFFKPWRLRFAKEQRLPLLFYGLMSHVDLTGAALALGAGACWAVYILTGQRAGAEHGPATVAVGSLIAAIIFVPIGAVQAGDALWHWSILPLGLAVAVLSTALPYSLEMIALTRLPTRTFGTLMSMEPALAAVSGMIFLGETLTGIQILALCAIIAASMGSTLTIRREPQIKQVDVK
ncbi:EamA family transporter [Salmonella enterica subsp. enterica serovar Infantis]|nr:EamA family transporter [Salmonella enterica subsp. enterica serovar Infantis]